MGLYENIQEAYRDAQQMERCSCISDEPQDEDNTQERTMTTITLTGHIYASQASYESTPRYYFAEYDMSKHGEFAQVCPHTTTAKIPDDFDIRPGLVEALKAEKSNILAEAQAKANALDERISKLLALPNHG